MQGVSAANLAKVKGSKFNKFLDEVDDFIVNEDKIGIPIFGKIRDLAVNNNYDFDEARQLYFKDVKERAEKESKGEVSIVLEDLGYYFLLLTPRDEFKREDDGHQQFWSLIDKKSTDNLSDQTALIMFHSSDFSSDLEGNPFLGLDAGMLFEFL